MGRIPWTRYAGDDVEAFASMCICRERPSARRIRPSSGDGGIDVYVPLGGNLVEVYQVKKFAENLTSNQLSQIKKSYERIKTYAKKRGWTLHAWHLTMPLDPTPENDEWFEKLTKKDPFKATWEGLTFFDNWAADFPQCVDYYLEGDRAQLEQDMNRFLTTTKIMLPEVDAETAIKAYRGLEPAGIRERLALLNTTINDRDPHYLYEFAIGSKPNDPLPTSNGYPQHVASVTEQIDDQFVTVHILARCAESLNERPITHKGTVAVEKDSEEERQWQQFLDYGLAPTRPIKVREFVVDLPGGFDDGTTEEGYLVIRELDDPSREFDRILSILGSDQTLGEVQIHFSPANSNHDGTGWSVRGTDPSGILAVEILTKKHDRGFDVTFNFTIGDVSGRFAVDVAPALAFVHHAHAPNTLRVADSRVRRRKHDQPLNQDRPRNREALMSKMRHDYVLALATIQQYADFDITVPDLESVDPHDAGEIIRIGRLLREGTITVDWNNLNVTLHTGVEIPERGVPHAWAVEVPLDIPIAGNTVPLGQMRAIFEAGEIADVSVDRGTGDTKVQVRPAHGKNTATLIWTNPDSIDN